MEKQTKERLAENIEKGLKLKKIRKHAKLTQEELAKSLGRKGYSRSTVSLIEIGSRPAGEKVTKDWAMACGVNVETIFTVWR